MKNIVKMKEITTEAKKLLSPDIATKYLKESVPFIKLTKFKFLEVKTGYCKSVLPLESITANQHGTHQALILGMAGDYTGGVALASIIGSEPILGVHEVTKDKGMSLWLIGSKMSYLRPSIEDVYVEAYIPAEKHEQIIHRYNNGKTIILEVEIDFKTKHSKSVAQGVFTYYCKKKSLLLPSNKTGKTDAMFEHIIKTSAKLISQLRYLESKKESPLFNDEISGTLAGAQGEVIANRFLKILPELQTLVAARTHDLDLTLKKYSDKIEQIIFVGIGLDFRMERHSTEIKRKTIYSLDLEEMLQYRKECSQKIDHKITIEHKQIQLHCDFLTDSISEKLLENGFDPNKPSFFIYEGCSMYFTKEENQKILCEISDLMSLNKNSLLWMDMVDDTAFDSDNVSIKKFLNGMARLGEPFICGFSDQDPTIKKCNLEIINKTYSTDYFPHEKGEIHSLYSYNLLKSNLH